NARPESRRLERCPRVFELDGGKYVLVDRHAHLLADRPRRGRNEIDRVFVARVGLPDAGDRRVQRQALVESEALRFSVGYILPYPRVAESYDERLAPVAAC